ncbi:hypothetical protein L615_001400000400 [Nocardioides sp. J9]|uniref:hypothetical protein n=1 Tax=unclassified Nocardioides TaxID=2615069 RepID=UPI00048FF157|nr:MULTISPECIES: hypothetical protein [unclassified Nocardioides]TWH01977.1 hypothetical protein L615_001400000400 [Nocardioides sp. J9]
MPIELTTAVLLTGFALLCGAFVLRTPVVVDPMPEMGPDIEEWRSAALHHFHEAKDLRRSVAEALSTPGAVTGEARRDLMVALGAPRVDVMA